MVSMTQIMKQAQAMQKKMLEIQDKLKSAEFMGTSGGGLINVTINGKGEMIKIKIDPSLLKDSSETEMLEDLIVAGFNDAKKKADSNSEGEMSGLLNKLGLPTDFKL